MVILLLHYVPSLAQHGVFPREMCGDGVLKRDFCTDSQLEVEVADGIAEVGF